MTPGKTHPPYHLGAWYIPSADPTQRATLPSPILSAMADGRTVAHHQDGDPLTADEALAAYQSGRALILA